MARTFNSVKYGSIEVYMAHERSRNNYVFTADKIVTRDEAMAIQKACGYHPAGYSFQDYKTSQNSTTWKCWNSCD